MQLYNTISRQVEEFTPRQAGKVGLYACGPTVYDFAHLGHLRKYTMDDVLVRVLRHAGYSVHFVENITDVGHLTSDGDTGEDKLEKGAKKYGKTAWDVALEFEEYYWLSMSAMGNLKPDVVCRATEHITEQLAMVQQLEAKGHTYVIEGDGVYFDTSTFPEYGRLAHLDLDAQQAGSRVEPVAGKRNPADFALWKFERPGENRAMSWPSPWAERSFPGWHIECSAMSMKYLGEQFDIHTGGIDHIPVHHTNEIAQAEAATGKHPFVNYWVHHNFLRIEGEKMSKSLGNFFTIDDILNHQPTVTPQALRLLFLGAHYRSELNFTWDALAGTQKSWEKLVGLWLSWQESDDSTVGEEQVVLAKEYGSRFFSSVEQDLQTPEALAVLWAMVKDEKLSPAQKKELLLEFDQVFGLGFATLDKNSVASSQPLRVNTLEPEIQELVAKRKQAREAKDFALADSLRDELASKGYTVVDSVDGQELFEK